MKLLLSPSLILLFANASAFQMTHTLTTTTTTTPRTIHETPFSSSSHSSSSSNSCLYGLADDELESAIQRSTEYTPGGADTPFAKRFADRKGVQVRTVGEAFADFTKILGSPINALYKNMMTDIVGVTHLTVVNARFVRDPVWSLGIVSALDLLLKNYPEKDAVDKIVSSLFQCVGLDKDQVFTEAAKLKSWAEGKTIEDIAKALKAEETSTTDDAILSDVAKAAKQDEYWMYSRFFGIGLLALMEATGKVEMTADDVYPILEDWMSNCLGKSHFTACSDSDTYFKVKNKLDMMETMMKEIEIREKKRMAQRLEDKAEAALRKAERDAMMKEEERKEAASNTN